MVELLTKLGAWNWLIAAAGLMLLEVFAPGVFLFWLGLAALVVGVLAGAIALSWQVQVLAFAVIAVALVPLWRRFSLNLKGTEETPFLNRRSEALVGRSFTLEKPIVDGTGTVRIDDTVWRVEGPDLPAGSRVRVVRVDGVLLSVARE